jgi:hypothetical protein
LSQIVPQPQREIPAFLYDEAGTKQSLMTVEFEDHQLHKYTVAYLGIGNPTDQPFYYPGVDPVMKDEPSPTSVSHTHVEYVTARPIADRPLLPFHIGDRPAMAMLFRNAGDFPVQEPQDSGLLKLVLTSETNRAFQRFRKMRRFNGIGGSLMPHSSQGAAYHTFEADPLTDDDVTKLSSGELSLCGSGSVRWKDETGSYETRFDQCLGVESGLGVANWHTLRENNKEYKLK